MRILGIASRAVAVMIMACCLVWIGYCLPHDEVYLQPIDADLLGYKDQVIATREAEMQQQYEEMSRLRDRILELEEMMLDFERLDRLLKLLEENNIMLDLVKGDKQDEAY
jgi:hypothetical protein